MHYSCGTGRWSCIDPWPYHKHILTINCSFFHHKQVVNKGAHVYGETYCYSYLSWGHGTVHCLQSLKNNHLISSTYKNLLGMKIDNIPPCFLSVTEYED